MRGRELLNYEEILDDNLDYLSSVASKAGSDTGTVISTYYKLLHDIAVDTADAKRDDVLLYHAAKIFSDISIRNLPRADRMNLIKDIETASRYIVKAYQFGGPVQVLDAAEKLNKVIQKNPDIADEDKSKATQQVYKFQANAYKFEQQMEAKRAGQERKAALRAAVRIRVEKRIAEKEAALAQGLDPQIQKELKKAEFEANVKTKAETLPKDKPPLTQEQKDAFRQNAKRVLAEKKQRALETQEVEKPKSTQQNDDAVKVLREVLKTFWQTNNTNPVLSKFTLPLKTLAYDTNLNSALFLKKMTDILTAPSANASPPESPRQNVLVTALLRHQKASEMSTCLNKLLETENMGAALKDPDVAKVIRIAAQVMPQKSREKISDKIDETKQAAIKAEQEAPKV